MFLLVGKLCNFEYRIYIFMTLNSIRATNLFISPLGEPCGAPFPEGAENMLNLKDGSGIHRRRASEIRNAIMCFRAVSSRLTVCLICNFHNCVSLSRLASRVRLERCSASDPRLRRRRPRRRKVGKKRISVIYLDLICIALMPSVACVARSLIKTPTKRSQEIVDEFASTSFVLQEGNSVGRNAEVKIVFCG